MKKYIMGLWSLALAAALMTGCAAAEDPVGTKPIGGATADEASPTQAITEATQPVEATTERDDSTIRELEFNAQYIRTNSRYGVISYPDVKLIKSGAELERYYEENRENVNLDGQGLSGATTGFWDACREYDEAFFKDNYLLMVLLEEGSGSISHRVTQVTTASEDRISVSIESIEPECGTCDMAQWHIILELSRDYEVADKDHVMMFLDRRLAWHQTSISPPVSIEPALTSPPQATLYHGEGSAPILLSGYSWFSDNGDGSSNAITTDALHPLDCKDLLEPISVTGEYVKLEFEDAPNTISVRCWPDTAWGSSDTPSEVVNSYDFAFDVKPGGYVYEITAIWNEAGNRSYGTAHYYAYVIR